MQLRRAASADDPHHPAIVYVANTGNGVITSGS